MIKITKYETEKKGRIKKNLLTKIDFIESFSKSQNIYADESIKSPITKNNIN